ncbi:SEC-C motif-containing protein [Microbacterium resistens]|uniref:UPF0225 protein J2Y69_000702 n=1 Tax=Microbacterium resistens TaxID=156977 RepID=A0ABU1S922_9MICO|nr:YchJ family metal-binding protein [Microbacterium resistens]MDR6866117.1 SEC-C motif-containing protein [Microbacterium resistens]
MDEKRRRCPCGTGDLFASCCGPILGGRPAPTAERLMRSRYTAFARRDEAYLLRSWHPSTRPSSLDLDDGVRWLGLEILGTEAGGPFDREGVVSFIARYRDGAERGALHEVSRFTREGREWRYLDGVTG